MHKNKKLKSFIEKRIISHETKHRFDKEVNILTDLNICSFQTRNHKL